MRTERDSQGNRGRHGQGVATVALVLAAMITAPTRAEDVDLARLESIPLTGCLSLSSGGRECTEPVTLEPVRTDWGGVQERLDPQSRIPGPEGGQLSYTTGKLRQQTVRTVDLSAEVPRWLSLRFDDPAYGASEEWVGSVGNLLQAFHRTRGNAEQQRELLDRLRTSFPRVWEQVKPFLAEWTRDDFLYSQAWNPSKTGNPEEEQNDGILERPPFVLRPAGNEAGASGAAAGRRIYQACAPIYAAWNELFAAENDFGDYHFQVGSSYLEVYPVKSSYFSGLDGAGHPFLLYDVHFHQKPFPLWNLKFALRQFLHQEQGRWQMENHMLEGDMKYLRLRIFYDPILNSRGETVGYVKTEWIDLDIKRLPDGDSDRQMAARGDVGNIKRVAEGLVAR